jgi:hypothetical protein
MPIQYTRILFFRMACKYFEVQANISLFEFSAQDCSGTKPVGSGGSFLWSKMPGSECGLFLPLMLGLVMSGAIILVFLTFSWHGLSAGARLPSLYNINGTTRNI